MTNSNAWPDGYAVAPHWVMRNRLIPAHAKLVYVYLEGRLNEDGICWPSHQTTAEDLGISEASVKRAVGWLKENDLVTVTRRSKGFGTFNIYALPKRLPDHLRPKDQTDLLEPKDQNETPKGQNTPDQKVTQTYKEEPIEETPIEVEPILSAFDEFWKSYPRKVGKGQARRAWKSAAKKATVQQIMFGAVQFAQWCRQDRTEPQFIPYPATWLNGERWNDERTEPVTRADTRMQAHIAHVQDLWENPVVDNPRQLEG